MRGLPALLGALALCSCHVVFPFRSGGLDQGPPDIAGADRAAGEGKTPDIAHPRDGEPLHDAPFPDAPVPDAAQPDTQVPPGDQGGDAPWPLDTGPVSPQPCATGIQKGTKWTPGPMQLCLAAGAVSQCNAEDLCNLAGGWHLCTASEYLARGGAASGSGATSGWLASCVRNDGKQPTAPSDSRCAVCDATGSSGNSAEVGWWCTTGQVQYNLPHNHVGVRTHSGCFRVGENSAAYAAYWAPLNTGAGTVATAAACCAP